MATALRPKGGRIDFCRCLPPESAQRIVVSTYFMDAACAALAQLAAGIQKEFGGTLDADPEIARFL